jgi:two-component system sensor histidine kinase CpxA
LRQRFPLDGRLLLWLVLNLLLVLWALLVLLPQYLGIGWSFFLTAAVRERLQTVAESVAENVSPLLKENWKIELRRYNDLYGVDLSVFDGDGTQLAGAERSVPKEIRQELLKTRGLMITNVPGVPSEPLPRPQPGRPVELPGWPVPDREQLKRWIFVARSEAPDLWWIGVRTPLAAPDGGIIPATVLAATPNTWRALRFLNLRQWVYAGCGLVFASILLWLPLLWLMSRAIAQITNATERIAGGHFDARLQIRRYDELGRLAEAVNTMAERLDSFLQSQKHFLANIAHEVSSPLGRLRLALELLDQHVSAADREGREAFRDVDDEVQLVSELVSELLAFSRVGIGEEKPSLAAVPLRALFLSVLERERHAQGKVNIRMIGDMEVWANTHLLERAVGNLVRNAVRYAGTASGPIEVDAYANGKTVSIQVRDRGPGVPELSLLKLGDPFYRPEAARRRKTGGIGLGLATVKNCVAACGGTVAFCNREGGGFEAEIVLPRAEF